MRPVKPSPKPRQQVDRDARRQSLVDAARDLFAQKGYHATTVDDITRAAGVAKGTFYLYFTEKREVYYEVVRAFMNLIKDIGGQVGDDPGNMVEFMTRAEAAAHKLMGVFMENRELARLAYRESMGLDSELEAMVNRFYREIAEVEANNIRTAIALGVLRDDIDPLLVAYSHIGIVERVLLALAETPDDFPPPDVVVRQMMTVAFEGLRKR
jgi:AcrR family transcriptional regulator